MSKWGVPQLGSFNVDLVGKAWKSVESSIDKAIGISDQPPSSPNTRAPLTPDTTPHKIPPSNLGTPNPPSKLDSSTPTKTPSKPPSTPTSTTPPPQKANKPSNNDNISLEELLNGPTPIPSDTSKITPKITPRSDSKLKLNDPASPFQPRTPITSSPQIPTTPITTSSLSSISTPSTPTLTNHTLESPSLSNNNTLKTTNTSTPSTPTLINATPPESPSPNKNLSQTLESRTDDEKNKKPIDELSGKQKENLQEFKLESSDTKETGESTQQEEKRNGEVKEEDVQAHAKIVDEEKTPEEDPHSNSISKQEGDKGGDTTQKDKENGVQVERKEDESEERRELHTSTSTVDTPLSSPSFSFSLHPPHSADGSVTPPIMDTPPPSSPYTPVLREGSSLPRNASSSSSLADLGDEDENKDVLELKTKIIELNGKIAAIAIIQKEKDRQLDEKTQQIAIREKQLESSMERQAALSAELQNLTEEVEKLRSSKSSSSGSTNDIIESLKDEFSRRLGTTEKKLAAVTKERDELKKGSSMGDQAKDVLKAKDDEINTLRTEGTNLSLKILNLESAVKKYRATKKDDDATLTSLKERLAQAETLLEKRNEKIKQLENNEKKYMESITTMKDLSDNVARKLEKKELEFLQTQKQLQDLQGNLERANKDLLGAKKSSQENSDKHYNEVEEAKRNLATEYQIQSNKLAADYQNRITQLEATISELRGTLSSCSDQMGKKEDSLLGEIARLRGDLDAAEKRNEEIMQSIPNSTRPLLRQIEALQSLLDTKTRTADALEQDLRARLADEESRRIIAVEKERSSASTLAEMSHRVNTLEAQYEEEHTLLSSLRMEVETTKLDEKKYKRQLAEVSAKLAAAEMEYDRMTAELRQNEDRHQRTISAMKEIEEALNKSRDKEKELREELSKMHRFGSSIQDQIKS